MGQNQEGFVDRRGHVLRCAHDYNASGGQSVCVPFMVTNQGYALLWDNPSRTLVSLGFNGQNTFTSEVGQRVSFFIITGKTYDDFYRGFRPLTSSTPMLPKSAYGYIQCKQRYASQADIMQVAKGYRDRHLPIDDLVIDWFTYTKMGQMDMDPAAWPDPTGMLRTLHAVNYHVMISVWPRFVPESRYFKTIQDHGWFEHLADGTPTNGLPYDRAGSDIDTTNPEAAKWYWSIIKENYVSKGFDAFWADETEPDLPWPGPGQLYVGTCYQPVDRSPEEVDRDIAIMHHAGFNVVRMGDLSWDAFEPSQGQFTFAWFDQILDKMHQNGIRVILDIPGLPAPIWLHKRYPGVDIVAQNGTRLPAAERYMDDISDPDYVREVNLLADAMMKHYAHHPAVIAVGYDNEIGNGYLSYSAADRLRFIEWLKKKYGTITALNQAWATQRWSRHLNSFEEVDLPLADGPGPSERFLDLHRFWSDVVIARLNELEAIRKRDMPDLPTISNLWDTSPRRGFDYLSSYKSYVSFGAEGFYPGDPVSGAMGALLTKGDLPTPIWFNEFTAGGGGYYGTPGRSRMYAYLGLVLGGQGILAWTFNSHLGGEEQALFGLVDHDNTPSWKVDEFAKIAAEFKKLEPLGFPRYTHPEVAIAYSFDSFVDSHPNGPSSTTLQYFKPSYTEQVQGAFEPLFRANIDTAFVHVGHTDLSQYKLVVVPADYVMDPASANALRSYVRKGGTVLMTAFSAKVNEHGLWFNTPLPGDLSDVFGLKTNAF